MRKEVEKEIDEQQLFCNHVDRICKEESKQLKTLEQFVADMMVYLTHKTDKENFTIPDMWTISLEKNTTIRWIEKYMSNRNNLEELSDLKALKMGIQQTANCWVNIVFLLERCMYLKEWKYSDKLKEKLLEVQEKEIENYSRWKMLKE